MIHPLKEHRLSKMTLYITRCLKTLSIRFFSQSNLESHENPFPERKWAVYINFVGYFYSLFMKADRSNNVKCDILREWAPIFHLVSLPQLQKQSRGVFSVFSTINHVVFSRCNTAFTMDYCNAFEVCTRPNRIAIYHGHCNCCSLMAWGRPGGLSNINQEQLESCWHKTIHKTRKRTFSKMYKKYRCKAV